MMESYAHLTLAAVILSLAPPAATAAEATGFIHLEEIDGRSWLVDSKGKPFFAHGITHIGTVKIGAPYEKIAEACKDAGFNAYGYGCPDALKDDMPYIASVNHLVPMSLYRGDGSFSYVDIFDPKVQRRLDGQIRYLCNQNKDNPNLIGAFWCNPVDSTGGFQKNGIKQGFFDKGLAPRPGLIEPIREFNKHREEITPR